jgi:hypothetical protein
MLGLKYVLVHMEDKDQNEMIFSTFNCEILYLTIPIVCRKNLTQSHHTDCKIVTIEEEEKVFFCGDIDNVLKFNRN